MEAGNCISLLTTTLSLDPCTGNRNGIEFAPHPCSIIRALKGEFWITGLQGENLGLWDYTLFEIGITEIRPEIGIMGFHTEPNWD